MDGAAVYRERRLMQALREGGVGVNDSGEVFSACMEGHRGDRLGNQLGSLRPEDMHAEQAIAPRVAEHLDQAFGVLPTHATSGWV